MSDLTETVSAIEAELGRLGWLCTDDSPCYFCVSAEPMLPAGWVRIYDDWTSGAYNATEILGTLKEIEVGAEYGEGLEDNGNGPTTSRDWPDDLFETEQLEEGTMNDQPNTLIRIKTNAGDRWTAGPHGVFNCAISDAFSNDAWFPTREEALASVDVEGDE